MLKSLTASEHSKSLTLARTETQDNNKSIVLAHAGLIGYVDQLICQGKMNILNLVLRQTLVELKLRIGSSSHGFSQYRHRLDMIR